MAKQGDGELELQPHLLSFVQRGLAQRCLRVGGSISLERSVGEGSDPVLLRVVLRSRCGRVAGKRGMLERPSRMDHDCLLQPQPRSPEKGKQQTRNGPFRVCYVVHRVHVLHARRNLEGALRAHASEDTNTTQKCIHRKHRPATSVVAARRPLPSQPLPPPCPVCTSPADALMPLMQSCTITRGHPGVTRHAHDTTEPLCTSTALDTPSEVYPRSDAPPVHSSISHTLYGRHARPSVSQPSSPPMSAPPHS
jgi:hypothetical protein